MLRQILTLRDREFNELLQEFISDRDAYKYYDEIMSGNASRMKSSVTRILRSVP